MNMDAGIPTYGITNTSSAGITTFTSSNVCQCSGCKPAPAPPPPNPQPGRINISLTRFDNGWTIETTTYGPDPDDWEYKANVKRLVHPAESVFDAVQQALSQALFPAPDNGKQDAE